MRALLAALLVAGCVSAPRTTSWTYPPSAPPQESSPAPSAPSSTSPLPLEALPAPSGSEEILDDDGEGATTPSPLPSAFGSDEGAPEELPYRSPNRPGAIELYTGLASILPGESLPIRVSTSSASYRLSLFRLTATGSKLVWNSEPLIGRDRRELVRIAPATGTVRAHWPISARVDTTGLRPGIYIIAGRTAEGSLSRAIVVLRTPRLDPRRPAYVHNTLTATAYNRWGDWSFYRPRIATRVSLDRPLSDGGLGYFARRDAAIVRWLLAEIPGLQFTTDYDLAHDPPGDDHPSVLLFGSHTEYVPGPMRDWVGRHLGAGVMNVAILGANSFYWRTRLEPAPEPGRADEMTCYKLFPEEDPARASDPSGRYRDLGDPEGAWLGSQYTGVVGTGHDRFAMLITDEMPAALLEGTGWEEGTALEGYLSGETDGPFAPAPGVRSLAVAIGPPPARIGTRGLAAITLNRNEAGGRVFAAGTFLFGRGLEPDGPELGVDPGSYQRFARNVLRWLGIRPRTRDAGAEPAEPDPTSPAGVE